MILRDDVFKRGHGREHGNLHAEHRLARIKCDHTFEVSMS